MSCISLLQTVNSVVSPIFASLSLQGYSTAVSISASFDNVRASSVTVRSNRFQLTVATAVRLPGEKSDGNGGGALSMSGTTGEETVENVDGRGSHDSMRLEAANKTLKPRIKLGSIMEILNKQVIEASACRHILPDIRTGDIVEIKLENSESKRRLITRRGIVMARQNAGAHTTIRIRNVFAGVPVEIVFPVYSPLTREIKVLSHRKVRRAKLYYLRNKLPKFSTFN